MPEAKDVFREAFLYHRHYNDVFTDIFKEHKSRLPESAFELFCHVLNAQQIWCARILALQAVGVKQLHEVERCKSFNAEIFGLANKILDEVELEKPVTYTNTSGQTFTNSVSDILFHVNNHSTHHKGQIAMQIRIAGLKPPVTDFIFYKRLAI